MGEPRWTVNDCGDPEVTNGYGKPFALTRARTNLQRAEHDALVAAVRDSERLPAVTAERDALAAIVQEFAHGHPGWGDEFIVGCRFCSNEFNDIEHVERAGAHKAWCAWRRAREALMAASSPDTERVTPEQAAELAAVREATGAQTDA